MGGPQSPPFNEGNDAWALLLLLPLFLGTGQYLQPALLQGSPPPRRGIPPPLPPQEPSQGPVAAASIPGAPPGLTCLPYLTRTWGGRGSSTPRTPPPCLEGLKRGARVGGGSPMAAPPSPPPTLWQPFPLGWLLGGFLG